MVNRINIFQPDAPMSRAMLVTTLYRLVGEPKPTVKQPVFPDVPVWTWYSDAMEASRLRRRTSSIAFRTMRTVPGTGMTGGARIFTS